MADPNRFMIGSYSFHYVRRVLNIVHILREASDMAVLALDDEKAFDRVEWTYLFEVLGHFGLGEGFCN